MTGSANLRRVLYIEDDPDIRLVATLALELVGNAEVCACADGNAAIAAADFGAELLLIDVMMPGRDGPATLAMLRAHPAFADIPAVFFTAKVRPEEVQRLVEQGAIGVVGKPFDPQTLFAQLCALWDAHRGA